MSRRSGERATPRGEGPGPAPGLGLVSPPPPLLRSERRLTEWGRGGVVCSNIPRHLRSERRLGEEVEGRFLLCVEVPLGPDGLHNSLRRCVVSEEWGGRRRDGLRCVELRQAQVCICSPWLRGERRLSGEVEGGVALRRTASGPGILKFSVAP